MSSRAAECLSAGLYIPDLPQYGAFRGIGVRIEDDVLLTAGACRVLSDQVRGKGGGRNAWSARDR